MEKQEKSLFRVLRASSASFNLCNKLKEVFNHEEFLNNLKKHFKNLTDKKSLNRVKIPENKNLEYLSKIHAFKRRKTRKLIDEKEIKIKIGGFHVYIFMGISFLYLVITLLCLDFDFAGLFLKYYG